MRRETREPTTHTRARGILISFCRLFPEWVARRRGSYELHPGPALPAGSHCLSGGPWLGWPLVETATDIRQADEGWRVAPFVEKTQDQVACQKGWLRSNERRPQQLPSLSLLPGSFTSITPGRQVRVLPVRPAVQLGMRASMNSTIGPGVQQVASCLRKAGNGQRRPGHHCNLY